MIRLFAVVMVSSMAMAQSSLPAPQSDQLSIPAPAVAPEAKNLPPIPTGKSTVIGGEIRSVDPVRDQVTLKVFGGNDTMKVLFDERNSPTTRNGDCLSTRLERIRLASQVSRCWIFSGLSGNVSI